MARSEQDRRAWLMVEAAAAIVFQGFPFSHLGRLVDGVVTANRFIEWADRWRRDGTRGRLRVR